MQYFWTIFNCIWKYAIVWWAYMVVETIVLSTKDAQNLTQSLIIHNYTRTSDGLVLVYWCIYMRHLVLMYQYHNIPNILVECLGWVVVVGWVGVWAFEALKISILYKRHNLHFMGRLCYFIWSFKGTLWHIIQIPIPWEMFSSEKLRARSLKSTWAILKRYPCISSMNKTILQVINSLTVWRQKHTLHLVTKLLLKTRI